MKKDKNEGIIKKKRNMTDERKQKERDRKKNIEKT